MDQAWEVRDQVDQAEEYYNHPLRVQNRELQDENFVLKTLLRENNISWPSRYASPPNPRLARQLRSSFSTASMPYLPAELMLKILSYALTSPYPIVDPLCPTKRENLTAVEKSRGHQIAIHFLVSCKAYHAEGTRFLWSNNTFLFTSVQALKAFSEVDLVYRRQVHEATLRIIAKFYDDEQPSRPRRLPSGYHHSVPGRPHLRVHKRAKEPTLARRGFRAYSWYQLVDFLESLLPPHMPSHDPARARTRLLPHLGALRIDFVNFAVDMLQYPPAQLHDIASHHLGCTLNELIVTGLPADDTGARTATELSGLLKDDGLMINHPPAFVAQHKGGLRQLKNGDTFRKKVVRSMRPVVGVDHHHHDDHPDYFEEFPPAPPEDGEPPESEFTSCRTIWKRVPIRIDEPHKTWELFDRVSGLPWEEVEEEALMYDLLDEDEEDEGGMMCENCGQVHPGAILPHDLIEDLYDDL